MSPLFKRYVLPLVAIALVVGAVAIAHAKLPLYPDFHLTRSGGTATISKFDFLCLPGLNNTAADTSFPVTMSFPAAGLTEPYTLSFSSGKIADGDWTCFANAVISTGERWPTNRVSFTLKQPTQPQTFILTVD